MSIIKRTIDTSYVIEKNGMPYHVPNEGEFASEWAEITAYAELHPDEVTLEEPYVPTEEEIAEAEKRRQSVKPIPSSQPNLAQTWYRP